MTHKETKLASELKFADEFDIYRARNPVRVKICSQVRIENGVANFSITSPSVMVRKPATKMRLVASSTIEIYKTKFAAEEMNKVLSFLVPGEASLTASKIAVRVNQTMQKSETKKQASYSVRKISVLLHRAALHKLVIAKRSNAWRFRLALNFKAGMFIEKKVTKNNGCNFYLGGWIEEVKLLSGQETPIVRWENGISNPVNEQMIEPVTRSQSIERIRAAKARFEGKTGLPDGHQLIPWFMWGGLVSGVGARSFQSNIDPDRLRDIGVFLRIIDADDDRALTLVHPKRRELTTYLDIYYPGWQAGIYDVERDSSGRRAIA